MYARFSLERERSGALLYKEIQNDVGPIHFHSQIELYFVVEGTMDVLVDGQRRILRCGEMAVSLSYDAHVYRTIGQSRSILLILPGRLSAEFMADIGSCRLKSPFIEDEEVVKELRFCADAVKAAEGNEMKQRGYLYVILGILREHLCLRENRMPVDNALSAKLLIYINDHYTEEISLSSLSAALGYAPTYLSRYFRSCFGVGIGEYVNLLRLRRALILLHTGAHTTTYCALESGFRSIRTFYRTFEKELGCTPQAYRTAMHSLPAEDDPLGPAK